MTVDIQIVSKHQMRPHGTTQLRCHQPAEYLRGLGYSVDVDCIYQAVPTAERIVILHRAVLDGYTQRFIDYARAKGCVIVYDTDDLIFDAESEAYLGRNNTTGGYGGGAGRFAAAMKACDVVTVSTEYLADRARQIHPEVHTLLNALSSRYLALAETVDAARAVVNEPAVTIGYLSGSKTHDSDFKVVEPALLKLLRSTPDARLVLVGSLAHSEEFQEFGGRFEKGGFVPYEQYANLFKGIDINIVPLEVDEPFCNAKSELKYLEAAACGVVTVASPAAPQKAAITDGRNGRLAEDDDWFAILGDLVRDRQARTAMGQAARRHVLGEYSPAARAADWKRLIDELMVRARPATSASPLGQLARLAWLRSHQAKTTLRRKLGAARRAGRGK